MGDEDISFELGDTVLLLGGQIDGLRGRIYYIDENLIRILPEGVSDRLVDIRIIDGDLDPALKIQHLYSISKRTNPAFVAQINAQVGEFAETFNKDGGPGPIYKILAIDETTDKTTLIDATGANLEIDFAFRGVPLDEAFAVIRPRQGPTIEEETENVDAAALAEEEVAADDIFEDVLNDALAGEITEISVTERTYPDNLQRNDMLHDLISALDVSSQKNPERQKEIRLLVEQFMNLRNSILTYSRSGEPSGKIPTSYISLGELLAAKTIPLSRPVLKAKKALYLDHSFEGVQQIAMGNPSPDPVEIPGAEVDIYYLQDVVNKTVQYMETQLGGIQSENISADSLPEWYLSWKTLNETFHSTWSVSDEDNLKKFKHDTDFLRAPVDIYTAQIDGLPKLYVDKNFKGSRDDIVTGDSVGKIELSLMRGLGPRSTRIREKEPPRIVDEAEEGSIYSTLIFPLSERRNLGSTRSGRVALDIAFSQYATEIISEILQKLDGIPEVPTTGGIISIGEEGNTNGAILIEDWLANQPLYPLGLADATVELASYGFTDQELNVEQQEVLVKKIDAYRALIKQFIMELRDFMSKVISEQKTEDNPFLQGEAYENLFKTLEGEPLLTAIMRDLQNCLPLYKASDIAMVAGIIQTSADLFMTTMAQVPGPLAMERNRKVRDQYLQALTNALLKSELNSLAVFIPQPNDCTHVRDLVLIRKQKDIPLQMQLFAKFLTKYEGQRKNNWVDCSVCKQHLVCYHEVLLLKEFLYPREKDALHKELLLSFSGGQFHGKYICKNCGQPISDLEYDMNIEFTDEGVPMSGRAVLDKAEEGLAEVLDDIMGPDLGLEEEIEFDTPQQKVIYRAARKLFDVIGIHARDEVYPRVVQRVEADLVKLPSREEYKQINKGKRVIDYDVFVHRILVGSLGANVLIEVQTDFPGYVIRYKIPGCRAGFSGYPLSSEKDRTGVEYIVCAVSTIRENEIPWNLTGFQNETNEKKRQDAILAVVNRLLESTLTNAMVQQQLAVKRAHLEKVYGTATFAEQLPERIPEGFLPLPYVVVDATTPVVSEAATPKEKIRGWVASAHQLGKENGNYVKGTPFSDATCCMAPLKEPGKFWKERGSALPQLPLKTPPRGPTDSHLAVHFKPRPVPVLEGTVPQDVIYKIFLKVCYTGDRMGLPHVFGYTNTCAHCGFRSTENPYAARIFPPISAESMKNYEKDVAEIVAKGKVDLDTQNVDVNSRTFEAILDATHMAFRVTPYVQKKPLAGMELFERLRMLNPEPFDGWTVMITETMTELAKLAPKSTNLEIANAYGKLSNYAADVIEMIKGRIGAKMAETLKKVLEDSSAVENVKTYFLIPFQRLVVDFQVGSLKIAPNYKLHEGIEDDINTNIVNHLEFLNRLKDRVTGTTKEKMKWARDRLADATTLLQKYIRGAYIPGGSIGFPYVTTALLGGILAEFIDPNFTPPGGYGEGTSSSDPRHLLQILDVCIQKLDKEGLRFTDDEIKALISQRDEKEKLSFINRFENLTPQEKAVAKMIKKLGLKEWAVGGTKAIYAYDPEQYERERAQRNDMGFTELVDTGVELGGGAESGYENQQVGEDDY